MVRLPGVLTLVVALVLVACGGAGSAQPARQGPSADQPDPDQPHPDRADRDRPVSNDDPPSKSDAGSARMALPEARQVHHGVRDAAARPFERSVSDETDGSLHIIYWTGVEPCAVLGGIEVVARPDVVTVTLMEGHLPADDGESPVCIEIAQEASAPVPVDEPIGDRVLIDGWTGEPVPVERIEMSQAASS